MKKLLLAAAGLMAMGGSAFAADMGAPPVYKAAPPPAPVYNWTGCYLGAGGGFGMYNIREQTLLPLLNGGTLTNVALDQGGQGWLGMGSVGCDYQFSMGGLGNVVIGAFGDGAFSNIRGLYTGNSGAIGLISGYMKQTSQWDGGGRIGVLITPALLAYESVGYSNAHFSGVNLVTNGGVPAGTEPSANYGGWFLGSGFEYSFNNRLPIQGLFLKTEYRYYDYGGKNLKDFTAGGGPNGNIDNVHPRVQTVTTELVYRFNWH